MRRPSKLTVAVLCAYVALAVLLAALGVPFWWRFVILVLVEIIGALNTERRMKRLADVLLGAKKQP